MNKISIKSLRQGAIKPMYGSDQAAGADLHACLSPDDEPIILNPGERGIIQTGLAIELPPGFEAQIRSRSGLAIKSGIIVLNSPGTIDADYRGEIGVMLMNVSDQRFTITHGDRIAQMVIAKAPQFEFIWTGGVLSETERGEGGFGSTGVSSK